MACCLLRDFLGHGPKDASEGNREAKAVGLSPKQIRTARQRLKVVPRKSDFEGGWIWELPDTGRPNGKAVQNPVQYGAESGGIGSQTGFQQPDRESFEPSTVPNDTAQCEGERKSGKTAQREWMGIEPTRPLFRGLTGFEARDRHQLCNHSRS